MPKLFPIPYYLGKTIRKRDIIKRIKDFDVFVEPLCGSAEVSIELMLKYYKLGIKKIFWLNDICEPVMKFHFQIYSNERMTDYLGRLSETQFERIKAKQNYCDYDIFNLWINSYRYYINMKDGRFIGRYNPNFQVKLNKIPLIHKLYNFHEVHFRCCDYQEFFQDVIFKTPKIIVYFDSEEPIYEFLNTFDYSYISSSYRNKKEYLSWKIHNVDAEETDRNPNYDFSSEYSYEFAESSGFDIERMCESEYYKNN